MTAYTEALQSSWVEFVGRYHWQWFCTFTFRYPVHPEKADKLFRVWISKLNREMHGSRWHKKPERTVFWVRALEWQKRNVIHYHALIGCHSKNLNHYAIRNYWAELWRHMAGFSRIEVIRSMNDVNEYVTKYTTKGGEIDVSPNMQAIERLALDIDPYDQFDGP